MRKNAARLVVILLAGFLMVACTRIEGNIYEYAQETEVEAEKYTLDDHYHDHMQVIQSGQNFRISQIDEQRPWLLRYEIFNNVGKVLMSHDTDRPAWITHVNENLLEFGIGAGTNLRMVRFYCVEDEVISYAFENPHFIEDDIIAYVAWSDTEGWLLAVRNIFDLEIFHREIHFDDFSPGVYPTTSSNITNYGDDKIKITYLSCGEAFDEHVILSIAELLHSGGSNYPRIIESGRNFRISQIYEDEPQILRYEIFTDDGEILYDHIDGRTGWIVYINENLLEFGIGAGAGFMTVHYISLENEVMSDVFVNPHHIKDEIIARITRVRHAYYEDWKYVLVVQHIFDPKIFYSEFLFEDFSPGMYPTTSSEIMYYGDGKIKITNTLYGEVFGKHTILSLDEI